MSWRVMLWIVSEWAPIWLLLGSPDVPAVLPNSRSQFTLLRCNLRVFGQWLKLVGIWVHTVVVSPCVPRLAHAGGEHFVVLAWFTDTLNSGMDFVGRWHYRFSGNTGVLHSG